jgi:hypothetical protein
VFEHCDFEDLDAVFGASPSPEDMKQTVSRLIRAGARGGDLLYPMPPTMRSSTGLKSTPAVPSIYPFESESASTRPCRFWPPAALATFAK